MPPILQSETIQVLILAIIQGIAEFLPISSSGHLVVVGAFLGVTEGTTELNIILHFGTLVAIVLFYWKRIIALLTSDRKVIPLLIVGTLPAVVVGLTIKKLFPEVLENVLLAGFMLSTTGMMLLFLPKIKVGETDYQKIGYGAAFLIGCAQAFAILPGISRSGSTIIAGAVLGMKRQSAATFSFLLAIPVILGATVLEVKEMFESPNTISTPILLLGMGAVVSLGVGLLSLSLLVRWLEKGKLHWFANWLIPFGFGVVVWQLNRLVQAYTAVL